MEDIDTRKRMTCESTSLLTRNKALAAQVLERCLLSNGESNLGELSGDNLKETIGTAEGVLVHAHIHVAEKPPS